MTRRAASRLPARAPSCRATPTVAPFKTAGRGDDNCFYGAPRVVDAVLEQFASRYAAVWAEFAKRWPAAEHGYIERQLIEAARLAGVGREHPCQQRLMYCAWRNEEVPGWCPEHATEAAAREGIGTTASGSGV